jgi:carbamoyltransferase
MGRSFRTLFSKIKNDHYLNQQIVDEAMTYGPFDKVVYYERPMLKKMRQWSAGQYRLALDPRELPRQHLKKFGINRIDEYVLHHESRGHWLLHITFPRLCDTNSGCHR